MAESTRFHYNYIILLHFVSMHNYVYLFTFMQSSSDASKFRFQRHRKGKIKEKKVY